jgi:hypothetical protein
MGTAGISVDFAPDIPFPGLGNTGFTVLHEPCHVLKNINVFTSAANMLHNVS